MKKFSDQQILEGIRKGEDSKILEFLYDTVLPDVKKMVYKYRGSEDEAYDMFQEGILKFYSYVKTQKFDEKHKVGGFIYTVCKNLYIDYLRRQNKNIHMDDLHPESFSEEAVSLEKIISNEKEAKILELFSKIGEVCKDLLILSYYHDLTMKEISVKMGFNSEDVAKTKKYKCKQRLLQLVQEDSSYVNMLRYD